MVVSQAVPVAQPQSQNEGLPVPGPIGKKRGSLAGVLVGAGVREVDAGQPVPVVLQGPGVGVGGRDTNRTSSPVLQGPAANVPNLQLTLMAVAISMHARAHIGGLHRFTHSTLPVFVSFCRERKSTIRVFKKYVFLMAIYYIGD